MCAPVGSLRTCRKANVHVLPASLLAAVDPGFLAPRRYGKIVSTKAILDKTTNKCKGEQLGWGSLGCSTSLVLNYRQMQHMCQPGDC